MTWARGRAKRRERQRQRAQLDVQTAAETSEPALIHLQPPSAHCWLQKVAEPSSSLITFMYVLSSGILPSAISLLLPMKTFPKQKHVNNQRCRRKKDLIMAHIHPIVPQLLSRTCRMQKWNRSLLNPLCIFGFQAETDSIISSAEADQKLCRGLRASPDGRHVSACTPPGSSPFLPPQSLVSCPIWQARQESGELAAFIPENTRRTGAGSEIRACDGSPQLIWSCC